LSIQNLPIEDILKIKNFTDTIVEKFNSKNLNNICERENTRFNVCPHCGGTHFIRNGHAKNKVQRYLCKDCLQTYTSTYDTPFYRLKYPLHTVEESMDLNLGKCSARYISERLNIHKNTALL
jgi:transposase-like protein